MKIISDIFFIAGVFLLSLFIFSLSSRGGLFDSFEYSIKKFFHKTNEDFFDFSRNKIRTKLHWWELIAGLIFIIASIIVAFC